MKIDETILAALNEHTKKWGMVKVLGYAANIHPSYISQIKSGKYPDIPDHLWDKLFPEISHLLPDEAQYMTRAALESAYQYRINGIKELNRRLDNIEKKLEIDHA